MIYSLKLDIDHNNDDLELVQFESLVFSEILGYLNKRSLNPDYVWAMRDVYWVAEAFLKGWRAWNLWKGPRFIKTAQFFVLLARIATQLVKQAI